MRSDRTKPQAKRQTPAHQHERTDASFKGIVGFLAVMLLGAIILHVTIWWWLEAMRASPAKFNDATHWRPLDRPSSELRQDFPRLQLAPAREMEAFMADQRRLLNSYGWIDQTAGVVRIPVERAMELITQRGLPRWGTTHEGQASLSPLELQRQRATNARPSKNSPQ